MSLLITSSNIPGKTNQPGIANPGNYRNHIKNVLTIPENSEVAVESVKINRNPQLDYETSSVTNFWFGERLSTEQRRHTAQQESVTYIIPTENIIRGNLNPLDFAQEFRTVIENAYSLHPEIDTVTGVGVSTTGTSTFSGFDYIIDQVGSPPTSLVPPASSAFRISGSAAYAIVSGSGQFTQNASGNALGSQYQCHGEGATGGPISLYDGELTFNVTQANASDWTVGLSRPFTEDPDGVITDPIRHMGMVGEGIGKSGREFYDYAVESKEGKIRLYHSVPVNTTRPGGNYMARSPEGLMMREIIYFEKNNTSFTSNNVANTSFATGLAIASSAITDITFQVENEKVYIYDQNSSLICAPVTVNASSKGQVPKPVGQTCWKMYPTVGLWDTADKILISDYECRTSTTIRNNVPQNNWFTRCTQAVDNVVLDEDGVININDLQPWTNAFSWVWAVDGRDLYQPYLAHDLTPGTPLTGGTIHKYNGISGSLMDSYENIFVMGKSERYMSRNIQLWQPNTMNVLGFDPYSINPTSGMASRGAAAASGASFTSVSRPNLSSESATFIRIPTLSHETYNFSTGNPSKILFQLPRFDNSGAEEGNLFFQNNDKTYVDLKNTAPLHLTDIDVQFVRVNETLVDDLTGNSNVVLHIRPK